MLFHPEVIEVSISARLFSGKAEKSHTLAAEIWPVEMHGEFITDGFPITSI